MRVSELISLRQQPEEKTEAITVRIPVSYVAHLDELSSSLDVTRQSLLTQMIKEGVDAALDEYDKIGNNPEAMAKNEEPEIGLRFFILNTRSEERRVGKE